MVKHTSGFMGNNAFDQARAFVVESANKMLEIRRPGSIKAASEAIQHAKAADAVKQCGKKDLLVRITLDHSDFEKLEVRCGREKIFEEDRGAAMAGRNRSGRVARSSTKATGSAHRAGADKKKSTQAGKALRGAGTIRTKVFLAACRRESDKTRF